MECIQWKFYWGSLMNKWRKAMLWCPLYCHVYGGFFCAGHCVILSEGEAMNGRRMGEPSSILGIYLVSFLEY